MNRWLFFATNVWGKLRLRDRLLVIVAVVLFGFVSGTRVLGPVMFKYVIDSSEGTRAQIFVAVSLYGMLFLVTRCVEEIRFAAYVLFEQAVQRVVTLDVLNRFYHIPFGIVLGRNSGEYAIIIDRGVSGIRSIQYTFLFELMPVGVEVVVFLIVLSLKASALIIGVSFLGFACFVGVTFYFTRIVRKQQDKWFAKSSFNFGVMSESIKNYETVRGFGREAWILERYGRLQEQFIQQVSQSLYPSITMGLCQGVILMLMVLTIVASSILAVKAGRWTIGDVVLINGLLIQLILPLQNFAGSYRILVQGFASLRQMVVLLHGRTELTRVIPSKNGKRNGYISFLNVNVELSGKHILKEIKCEIREGEFVAVVGKTGSGKSTFGKCLAGLIDYKGDILIATDIDKIFYMNQNVEVFNTDLFTNVALDESRDDGRVFSALKASGFDENEIGRLRGFNLGEGGARLSGGQKQRLGLARMLYYEADILIFDEPTSALDSTTAALVFETIKKASIGKTVILITHDQGLSKQAEREIVIDEGRLIE